MLVDVLKHSLMISGFVFLMMLVVEYLNVVSRGAWKTGLSANKWSGYFLAALLGATPGCLGAFAVVALYSHRVVSMGALVAAMIATSGDEAFVMLAMFPGKALLIMATLFFIGIIAGAVTDVIFKGRLSGRPQDCLGLELHQEEFCDCFAFQNVGGYWRDISLPRGILIIALGLYIFGLTFGVVGPETWNWVRVSLLFAAFTGAFIIATVPDHFLEEHLWRHVAKEHLPRVFLWTLGTLLLMHLLLHNLDLGEWIKESQIMVMSIACLVGLVPESGPHLMFVTLFAKGAIPFSILLASSIVQDGHGMLPLLAHSRRDFLLVKLVNLVVGLLIGFVFIFLGL